MIRSNNKTFQTTKAVINLVAGHQTLGVATFKMKDGTVLKKKMTISNDQQDPSTCETIQWEWGNTSSTMGHDFWMQGRTHTLTTFSNIHHLHMISPSLNLAMSLLNCSGRAPLPSQMPCSGLYDQAHCAQATLLYSLVAPLLYSYFLVV